MYKKYDFPAMAKLPGIKFDIEKLKQEVKRLDDAWVNVFQANRGLCATHNELAESNYHHFKQINLTYFEPTLNEFLELDDLRKECRVISTSEELGPTKSRRHKTKIERSDNLPPAMNEHNWYHPLPVYEGSYMQQAIESQFKATPIRVRLTRIEAGKYLTPHIDYDPSYAVRIIVPIMGTENVINVCWPRNQREELNMVADGSAYFLNTGFKHSVEHNGTQDRIALMFSLPTQEDVECLVKNKT